MRAAGIKLAVVSNSEGTVEAMLEEVGLRRHMEAVFDSWVVGVAKPDPAVFHLALDHLGVAARDAHHGWRHAGSGRGGRPGGRRAGGPHRPL